MTSVCSLCGNNTVCRGLCQKHYSAKNYQDNRERRLKHQNEYEQTHREERKAYAKIYCQKNKEKISLKNKEYCKQNKEYLNKQNREYYRKNGEKQREKQRLARLDPIRGPELEKRRQEYQKRPEVCKRRRELEKQKRTDPIKGEEIRRKQREYRMKPENRERIRIWESNYYYNIDRARTLAYMKAQSQIPRVAERRRKYGYIYQRKPEFRALVNTRKRERYANDAVFAEIICLRTRLVEAIKRQGLGKSRHFRQYGIDPVAILERIGPRPGENYHRDEIIPCSAFDLGDPEQVKMCFSPENQQWLINTENLKKGGKWIDEYGNQRLGKRILEKVSDNISVKPSMVLLMTNKEVKPRKQKELSFWIKQEGI